MSTPQPSIPQPANPRPQWGPHLQLVFSVLVGVALSQSFRLVSESQFAVSQLILVATVFYVVLDNWYSLTVELVHDETRDGTMVIVYLLALVSYSCLPFLFLSGAAKGTLEPPECLLINLSIICLLDAVRRQLMIRHFSRRETANKTETTTGAQAAAEAETETTTKTETAAETQAAAEAKRERIGRQFLLVVTGGVYCVLLAAVAAAYTIFSLEKFSINIRALIVPVLWLLFRWVDNYLIPRFSKKFYDLRAGHSA